MSNWRSPHDDQPGIHLGKRDALLGALALSLAALILQLAGAWYTGSLGLFGDSLHVLTDLFSLFMSLAAVVLVAKPVSAEKSFGLYRLEVLASFTNGLLLLVVAIGLAKEAIERLWAPEPVKALPLIFVASIGLIFNLLSAWLLHRASGGHGHSHQHHHHHGEDCHGHAHQHQESGSRVEAAHLHADRNLESALLHVWSDAMGSIAVIVGAVVIEFSGKFWVDALVGLLLALWIFRWSCRVISDSAHVLLESTPRHVNLDELKRRLQGLHSSVVSIEDLHVWELTSRMYVATAEVKLKAATLEEAESVRRLMHELMHDHFGIAHVVLAMRPA